MACAPQSWAAASGFLLLQSCLGLTINASRQVRFYRPLLPPSIHQVTIRNLRIGSASLDLQLSRDGDDVGVIATRRQGPSNIVIVK